MEVMAAAHAARALPCSHVKRPQQETAQGEKREKPEDNRCWQPFCRKHTAAHVTSYGKLICRRCSLALWCWRWPCEMPRSACVNSGPRNTQKTRKSCGN